MADNANNDSYKPIAVLGAGSWGTALAVQFARSGRETRLWGRNSKHMQRCAKHRRNKKYLPDAEFPETLTVEPDLAAALIDVHDVLIAVPSHGLRRMLEKIEFMLAPGARIAWATKGFELSSGKLPHQVVGEVLGDEIPKAVLSGPTFATEVGKGLPTAMTVAATDEEYATELAHDLSTESFRAYISTDIVGVEVGGAVKNVLAIGTGMSDGLGYGANTRVAVITRGLSEMTRLGLALGAKPETFMGLAGIGDLVLTCTDDQSRNRRMGLALASGMTVAEAAKEIGQVVEGIKAAQAVRNVAEKLDVEMPISEQIYLVIHEGKSPRKAVAELMGRDLKREVD